MLAYEVDTQKSDDVEKCFVQDPQLQKSPRHFLQHPALLWDWRGDR